MESSFYDKFDIQRDLDEEKFCPEGRERLHLQEQSLASNSVRST